MTEIPKMALIDIDGAAGDHHKSDLFEKILNCLTDKKIPYLFFTDSPMSEALYTLHRNDIKPNKEQVLDIKKLEKRFPPQAGPFKPIPTSGKLLIIESDRTNPRYSQKFTEYATQRNPNAKVIMIPENELDQTHSIGILVQVLSWINTQ